MSDQDAETFGNDPIAPACIPDYRDAQFEPVAPSFRRYVVLSTVSIWAPWLLVPAGIGLLGNVSVWLLVAMAIGLLALMMAVGIYRWIDAGYRGWALREHDLIAREGVLWRSVITLPVARIQHVETASGPLERAHGLARMKLFTAGGMTADLTVLGLDTARAHQLREYLVEQIRLRDASVSGQADQDESSG